MRRSLIALALAGSAATLALPAQASSYFTLEGTALSVGSDRDNDSLSPRGGRVRIGTRFSEHFDVEGHLALTRDRDSISLDTFETSIVGAYFKGYMPFGRSSAFYALAGFAGVSITQAVGSREFSDDRSGFSYGLGLETQLSETVDLTADWMRYRLDEGAFDDLSAVSLGLKLYF